MSFSEDMIKFAKKAQINIDLAHSKILIDLFSSLVRKSPVDTGRFRSNWQIGIQNINFDISKPPVGQGAALASGINIILSIKAGGIVYLTNSLPYAIPLEYGYSKQAPGGMVRLTLMEYHSNMNALLAGIN